MTTNVFLERTFDEPLTPADVSMVAASRSGASTYTASNGTAASSRSTAAA